MASRALAVSTAAAQFDALLDAARTTAREIDHGATIAFAPDAYGDGFVARLYRNRPAVAPPETATIPAVEARVSVAETATLGAPSFALAVHSNGAIAGLPGYVAGGPAVPETPCPPSGAYHLTFSYAGAHADRVIPCTTPVATTGTVSYAPPTSATIAPSPTAFPCAGSCIPTPPASPNPNPTCPPNYVPKDPSTCIPTTLTVVPSSLTFLAPGTPSYLTFTAQEIGYTAAFNLSDNCGGAISNSPMAGGRGPTATYSVSATRIAQCIVQVSDLNMNTATVRVFVRPALQPKYICDPESPARPYGTDLGPDPDGMHEDYSTGVTCATPSSQPTPAAGSPATSQVSPVCSELFPDDWSCSWTDSYSLPFADPPGTTIHITGRVIPASTIAEFTAALLYWNGNGFSTISIQGSRDPTSSAFSIDSTLVTPMSTSASYQITLSLSCADDGYAQSQGTACVAGTNSFAVAVSPNSS